MLMEVAMAELTDWQRRVKSDPAIHHGDACISGTRIPVSISSAGVSSHAME
jgi:hypothetical protein